MKIRSMTATFGRLENARLELGEGLNLIQAPNEGGKSTWCAFWRAMLYGIDTRDRDKKGHLADKNRYQPWSGAPMEGEVLLEWQGREITLRRGPRGSTPFGAFSAVYTATGEAVPGLTAASCGELLTGVGREVFERSAFIGSGGSLTVTAAPELEKRISALVSSGEEDVSFSQAQAALREWRNRRQVNRSVGLIPKLEGELEEVESALADLEEVTQTIHRLTGARAALERELTGLRAEAEAHRLAAREELDRRYTQALAELRAAQEQLSALEPEEAGSGPLPDKERLKQAQGELPYLKVLEEEIRRGEQELKEAEEAYVQAQIALQTPPFQGQSGEEAALGVQRELQEQAVYENTAKGKELAARLFPLFGLAAALVCAGAGFVQTGSLLSTPLYVGLALLGLSLAGALLSKSSARSWRERGERVLGRYGVHTPQELEALLQDYRARCQRAEEAAAHARSVRGGLNERKARRDNTRADLMQFVHTFAPQVTDLFGCSAALSRALNLEHETALARERVEERRRRLEDLAAQGGRETEGGQACAAPARSLEDTRRELDRAARQLEETEGALNRALGRQRAMGDPAALSARREELQGQLERRRLELSAITTAQEVLERAEGRLRERFSPALNRLAGEYLGRLTGGAYTALTLDRELEGTALRPGDVLPRSLLALSRGTADQVYLAVRLAVCRLCLPQRPPIVLDDALAAFDDGRLKLALGLLEELSREQQVLLFTCQTREGAALGDAPGLTRLVL